MRESTQPWQQLPPAELAAVIKAFRLGAVVEQNGRRGVVTFVKPDRWSTRITVRWSDTGEYEGSIKTVTAYRTGGLRATGEIDGTVVQEETGSRRLQARLSSLGAAFAPKYDLNRQRLADMRQYAEWKAGRPLDQIEDDELDQILKHIIRHPKSWKQEMKREI